MTGKPKLSKLRIAIGLLGVPVVAATMFIVPSIVRWPLDHQQLMDAWSSWLLLCMFGVPLSVATGLPLLLIYERFGMRSLWQYALGGGAIGVAVGFFPFFGGRLNLASLLMGMATGFSAVLFWAYAIADWAGWWRRLPPANRGQRR
jgi:hypothetical protein